MTSPLRTRRLLAAVAVGPLLSATLVACGSGVQEATDPAASEDAAAVADQLEPGEEVPVPDFVDLVAAGLESSTTARMTNSATFAGSEISGEGVVDYTTSPPSLRMTMEVPMAGGTMEVRSVGGLLYLSLGDLSNGQFFEIDPSDADGPLGRMGLDRFLKQGDPLSMLRTLEEGIQEVTYVGEDDVDGRELHHYELTADLGAALDSLGAELPPPATGSLPDTLAYDVWLDEQGRFGRMSVELDVSGRPVATETTLDDWGTDVTIEAPPEDRVTELPDLGRLGGTLSEPA